MNRHEPAFNIPPVVVIMSAVLVAVHVVRLLLPTAWDTWFTLAFAFIPARYSGYASALPGGDIASVTSFVTHTLVHGDFFHLMLNLAWLVAFGGVIAARLGAVRFILFYLFCAIVGAATFLAFNVNLMAPVIGASGAISGLMGGTMRLLFPALDMSGGLSRLREAPNSVPLMPLFVALRDKRVLGVTAAFLLVNMLALFGFGSVGAGGIAWEAHIGGYFAGLLTIGMFERPSVARPSEPRLVN